MRYALVVVLLLHGLIHLMGVTKAFKLANVNALTQPITRANGVLWLVATLLFVTAAVMLLVHKEAWWMAATVGLVLSQYLISTSWQDARFGTIANIIVLAATVIGFAQWRYHNVYRKDVRAALEQANAVATNDVLTENDIRVLPEVVKSYVRYTGAVGKPKVKSFKVEFSGRIRKDEKSEWMPFTSEQYNTLNPAKRMFFMRATMKHLPVAGYHKFDNGKAFMDIRLLSIACVQYETGVEMGVSETVTFFNDMCVMAPATLIDPRIKWLASDSNIADASFTNNGITVTARLSFNDVGELVNFISNDRYAASDEPMKQYPWLTPIKEYRAFNGVKLATDAQAVYRYPDRDLVYGEFQLTIAEYNVTD
jgi:hypothetical protein